MDEPDCIQRKTRYITYCSINIPEVLQNLKSCQPLNGCEGSFDEMLEVYTKLCKVVLITKGPRDRNSSRRKSNLRNYSD